jgi:AraC-like DNA-binding protein
VERRTALPLQRRQIFATQDAEEARAFLGARGFLLDIPPREATDLDMQLKSVFLPGLLFTRLEYGAAVQIRTTENYEDYRFVAPLRGRLCATIANEDVPCRPGAAVLVSPTLDNLLRVERDTAGLNILLSGFVLRRQLAALLGEALKSPLEFAAPLSLREGHGRSLVRFARLAMDDLERPNSTLLEPTTARSFREFVTSALLLHQLHNYRERLQRLERPAAPRDVKRAVEYMRANLDAPIGLPEIVAASGVPGRTLLQHFRDFKGGSPMRYLRTARYEKVREALHRAEPEEGITEVATKWGFTHMGRFSVEYRRRFGESPSETLRRRGGSCQ